MMKAAFSALLKNNLSEDHEEVHVMESKIK